jgi:hypothetical protein
MLKVSRDFSLMNRGAPWKAIAEPLAIRFEVVYASFANRSALGVTGDDLAKWERFDRRTFGTYWLILLAIH